jgi:hypothetical protein
MKSTPDAQKKARVRGYRCFRFVIPEAEPSEAARDLTARRTQIPDLALRARPG